MGGTFRRPVTRRTFLKRAAALSAAAWAQPLTGRMATEAWAQTAGTALFPGGTTLEATITTVGDGPYFALGFGPGWPIQVRDDLAAPTQGRQDRRVALASVLHYTDFQLVDAQSPARVEFLEGAADPPSPIPFAPAHRPQEALICHVVEALVRRSRELDRSPVTGREVDCVVCTGDNIDNTQQNEMRWFRTLMDGGAFAPNSGDPEVFEGVQSFSDPEFYRNEYWHPTPIDDPRAPDDYRRLFGFVDYPDLLDAAIREFQAVGLSTPWYSAYGNHDFLVQGNVERNETFEQFAVGGTKILGPPADQGGGRFVEGLAQQDPQTLTSIGLAPARPVTADPERHLMRPEEYIRAHLDSPASPGPVGHGFTEDNLDPLQLYYTFEVAPGITGITLDTTAPATSSGTIGETQVAWLEARLQEVHSRYFDAGGTEVTTGNDDRLVVIFGHHRPASMTPAPYTRKADGQPEQGLSGDQLLEVLHRYPNVVLWVNGHSHFNRILAHPDPAGRTGGIWDITTSAQIDPPQQARFLEIVDNRDGTLSIFTTVIDHGAPPGTDPAALDLMGLASIAREVSFNDFQSDAAGAIGQPGDLNTELLVDAPFDLVPSPAAPSPAPEPPAGEPAAPSLPATGAGLGAAAVGAAAVGAMALRRRGSASPDDRGGREGEDAEQGGATTGRRQR